MRLFSALRPPQAVLDDLRAALEALDLPPDDALRWSDPAGWHITLGFYGDEGADDLARSRAEWLAPRVAGCAPPRVELTGCGTFPGVLWAGVGGDLRGLHALGLAAGAGDPSAGPDAGRPYHPHLTLARWRAPRQPQAVQLALEGMTGRRGPSWLATEVVLLRSEPRHGGPPRYRELRRLGLLGTTRG